MRRDLLLLEEMIEASAQAVSLVSGTDLDALASDRQRRDALLWNFTVLGEAAAQLDADIKIRQLASLGPCPLGGGVNGRRVPCLI